MQKNYYFPIFVWIIKPRAAIIKSDADLDFLCHSKKRHCSAALLWYIIFLFNKGFPETLKRYKDHV